MYSYKKCLKDQSTHKFSAIIFFSIVILKKLILVLKTI